MDKSKHGFYDRKNCHLEYYLIRHCSPTLAGIKTGNLFNYTYSSGNILTNSLSNANRILNPKGVYAEILCIRENSALIYVYRKSTLCHELAKTEIKTFLNHHGYHGESIRDYLSRLKFSLLVQNKFPHEIGVFLGYPLHDVIGFIENQGQNSRHTGYWKVYHNERESIKLFEKFNKCKEVYMRLFLQDRPIERLIVAA